MGKDELGFQFRQRAGSDRKMVLKSTVAFPGLAFGNVAGNGNCGTLHLRNQGIAFCCRKALAKAIDFYNEIHRLLPNEQVAINHWLRRYWQLKLLATDN